LEYKIRGYGISEIRLLKQLEVENNRLKQMVADLDKQLLQDVLKKMSERPST
jgi:ribosomal protein L12E/L44/L45/RPP1/RPP2